MCIELKLFNLIEKIDNKGHSILLSDIQGNEKLFTNKKNGKKIFELICWRLYIRNGLMPLNPEIINYLKPFSTGLNMKIFSARSDESVKSSKEFQTYSKKSIYTINLIYPEITIEQFLKKSPFNINKKIFGLNQKNSEFYKYRILLNSETNRRKILLTYIANSIYVENNKIIKIPINKNIFDILYGAFDKSSEDREMLLNGIPDNDNYISQQTQEGYTYLMIYLMFSHNPDFEIVNILSPDYGKKDNKGMTALYHYMKEGTFINETPDFSFIVILGDKEGGEITPLEKTAIQIYIEKRFKAEYLSDENYNKKFKMLLSYFRDFKIKLNNGNVINKNCLEWESIYSDGKKRKLIDFDFCSKIN